VKPIYIDIIGDLKKSNIRPSIQRIAILKYLKINQSHPTADQIYTHLQQQVPTISKSTIYNTLDLFAESGLIRTLSLEGNEMRYDIITEPHGHFICDQCRTIFNFSLTLDSIKSDELKDFKIIDKTIYYKGICAKCLLV